MREPYVCLNGDPRILFMIFKRGEVGSLESDQVRQVGSRSKNVLRLATLSLVKVYMSLHFFQCFIKIQGKTKQKKRSKMGCCESLNRYLYSTSTSTYSNRCTKERYFLCVRLSSVVVLVDTWCLLVLLQVQAPGTGSEGECGEKFDSWSSKASKVERTNSFIDPKFIL